MEAINFSSYWEENKELYAELGVSKATAKKIWGDAIDAATLKLILSYK